MLHRVKKNDVVCVKSGKDRGKRGEVLNIFPRKGVAVVKDVGIVTRHVKGRKGGEKGKIVKEEKPIQLCKLMPVCSSCKNPCRVKVKFLSEGEKARMCSRCGEVF